MAETIIFLGPIITAILVLVLLFIVLKMGKSIIWLVINSIIGILVLIAINFLPFVNVTINIWSVLIVALGGIPGIVLVIALSYFGIAF